MKSHSKKATCITKKKPRNAMEKSIQSQPQTEELLSKVEWESESSSLTITSDNDGEVGGLKLSHLQQHPQ